MNCFLETQMDHLKPQVSRNQSQSLQVKGAVATSNPAHQVSEARVSPSGSWTERDIHPGSHMLTRHRSHAPVPFPWAAAHLLAHRVREKLFWGAWAPLPELGFPTHSRWMEPTVH